MKKSFMKIYILWVLFAMVAMPFAYLTAASCPGAPVPLVGPGVYTDQNLLVAAGVTEFLGPVTIHAVSCDPTVSVNLGAAEIKSNYPMRLIANAGRTITFDVESFLTFSGDNFPSAGDFLVTVEGAGEVRFKLAGGEQVSFTSLSGTGAAKVFVLMNGANSPTLRFVRSTFDNTDVQINVGPNAILSYLAPTAVSSCIANETGSIIFDATNIPAVPAAQDGRMKLNIDDNGSVVIAGQLITDPANPSLANINLAVPAGREAKFSVINTSPLAGTFSSLFLINGNAHYPSLLNGPCCGSTYTGIRPGFILGANGNLHIGDSAYLDYVGIVNNVEFKCTTTLSTDPCVTVTLPTNRNPSAFFVDGDLNGCATPAKITMDGKSAIYFRSGVEANGNVNTYGPSIGVFDAPFIVDPTQIVGAAGNVLFDVEGLLNIFGATGENVLQILSLEVVPTGGSVFIESSETIFPLRTFRRGPDGTYLRYNSGCMLINNEVNFNQATLQHTDENHLVFEKNSPQQSEPTYVGGDRVQLGCPPNSCRPAIRFFNGQLQLNTSAAFTGVDLKIPNAPSGNVSNFVFYQNGRCIDNGTGRQLVLGTNIGIPTCLCNRAFSGDSHLDIMQDSMQAFPSTHLLNYLTAPNNSKVVEGIVGNIANQFSIQTTYLANNSNISIGTNGMIGTNCNGTQSFLLTTFPELLIAGDFFSFDTQGGTINYPELSGTTGKGGIFVDMNGTISIADRLRANFSTMVTKSRNGIVNLPRNQVFFNLRVGISQWKLDLNDPLQRIIIGPNQKISDYTLDWEATIKDCTEYVPFDPPMTPPICTCPPLTQPNITAIPVVQGDVDQLQIKRSRLGDQVTLMVDGGYVRQLVFLTGYDSAEAPVGTIVVQNNGIVGLGAVLRNVDSLDAAVVLGVNGVTLAANGNGQILLNEDTLINNVCHILPGPDFGVSGPQRLLITSQVPRELRVKSDGILDLTAFKTGDQVVAFGGDVKVVLEPGAKIALGGGTLQFTDNAQLFAEQYVNENLPIGTDVTSTDTYRVKIMGTGTIFFNESSSFYIPRQAVVGIETDPQCTICTDLIINFEDAAELRIGDPNDFGGVLQVGNTTNLPDTSVNLTLIQDGVESVIDIDSQGMLGLGVGIVDKRENAPNSWLVGSLFNVGNISITLQQGTFQHNQIYAGDNILAGLIAIGPINCPYTWFACPKTHRVLGGGNIIHIAGGTTSVHPIVEEFSGSIGNNIAGLLGSTPLLTDRTKVAANAALAVSGSSIDLFNVIKTDNFENMSSPKGNIAPSGLRFSLIAYLHANGQIVRDEVTRIIGGVNTDPVDHGRSHEIGAATIDVNRQTGLLNTVIEIQQ